MVPGTEGTLEFLCPVCRIGTMCEHDTGYDECNVCNFYSIYCDGRTEYTEKEIRFAHEADAKNYLERKNGNTT